MNAWALLQMCMKLHCSPCLTSSECKRALQQKSVRINGEFPGPLDEVVFPVEDLVFFPRGKRKTTVCTVDYDCFHGIYDRFCQKVDFFCEELLEDIRLEPVRFKVYQVYKELRKLRHRVFMEFLDL